MIKFLFIIFFLLSNFSDLNANDVKINSIITLENNIPKECGLNFKILEENKTSDTKVSIKKNKDKQTTTFFSSRVLFVDCSGAGAILQNPQAWIRS